MPPTQNISLTKEEKQRLKDLAEKEHRSISKQVIHMMDHYQKTKDQQHKS